MKKLYPLYFLSLLVLFFGSCSTKKNTKLPKNSSTPVSLSVQQDSLSTQIHSLIDSSKEEPFVATENMQIKCLPNHLSPLLIS